MKRALEITLFSKANQHLGRRQRVENNHMLGKSGTIYLVTTRGQDISFPLHLKSSISASLEPEYYFRFDSSVRQLHLYTFLNSFCTRFLGGRGYCRSDSPLHLLIYICQVCPLSRSRSGSSVSRYTTVSYFLLKATINTSTSLAQ